VSEGSARTRHAQQLFAPLGPTYDRAANALSFRQDPRWRRFLVSRIPDAAANVLDVACGTGAVALELARRSPGRRVTGLDQSREMLDVGRARIRDAGLDGRITLREGRAESLPFSDGEFDALTFTYLLRYVDDPAATLRELARVVRPGGVIAMAEFGLPHLPWRLPWELYVRLLLPASGSLIAPAWWGVGRFLGTSIRSFYARWPLERQRELWQTAGIEDVRVRTMSFGAGVVVWGARV
jgi:demethylmenaquinone methyltransferase/2-methoxy-6-polyprenyl-1,4-benzoquinol methylase